ncbi:MAG: hypothetical protein AAFW60_08270, partial [Pseudomonadota bacterium]
DFDWQVSLLCKFRDADGNAPAFSAEMSADKGESEFLKCIILKPVSFWTKFAIRVSDHKLALQQLKRGRVRMLLQKATVREMRHSDDSTARIALNPPLRHLQ